jgi:hypothetical protein
MFVCALVEGELLEQAIAQQPGIGASALAWLACPRMLAEANEVPSASAFERLVVEAPVVLEGLSDELARRAVAFERALAKTREPAEVVRLARARETTLGWLVDAAAQKERWDLLTFIVDASREVLALEARPLDKSASLHDRAEARRAAGAHLRILARIGRQHDKMRLLRHFDENYEVAQLLLARWEPLGNDGFRRAAELLERPGSLLGD